MNSEEESKKKFTDLAQNSFQQTSIHKIIGKFASFSQEKLRLENKVVNIAGRIINRIRNFGELVFADLADQGGIIQLKIQNENFSEVKNGDIIRVTGKICKTNAQAKENKQELSIEVEKFVILTKCQQTPPDTAYFKLK